MEQDYLWPQIRDLPYFRGTLRSLEARWMSEVPLTQPVLDVGSGDGHFAHAVFGQQLDVGIDPDRKVMASAHRFNGYRALVQSDGAKLPFGQDVFASAVSNSVLEHIPHLDEVLVEVGRVLKPGAPFAFTVPNPGYRSELAVPRVLRRAGLNRVAHQYTEWFMRVTRTVNLLDREGWAEKMDRAGFTIEQSFNYFSPDSLAMLEWGHYLGVPCVLARAISGRWILVRQRWNLALTMAAVQRFYQEPPLENGTYSFYLARKR